MGGQGEQGQNNAGQSIWMLKVELREKPPA